MAHASGDGPGVCCGAPLATGDCHHVIGVLACLAVCFVWLRGRDTAERAPLATPPEAAPRALRAPNSLLAMTVIANLVFVAGVRVDWMPYVLRPKSAERSSPSEVLRRYERVNAKFAQPFFIGTLYGENVGAAVEKRVAWVRESVAMAEPTTVPEADLPRDLVGRALLDGAAIAALGCRLEPTDVERRHKLTCYWRRLGVASRDWTVFVNVVSADNPSGALQNADHPPAGGWLPVSAWPLGAFIRDAVYSDLADAPGPLGVRCGLFDHDTRCSGRGDLDVVGRVIGPEVPR